MAQLVSDIIGKFKILAQEDDYTHWTKAELIGWLNEAYILFVTLRPDATATRATVSLASGPYQNLDDVDSINLPDAFSLIRVVRNAGTNKRAIRFISEEQLNSLMPDWFDDDITNNIERWSYSPDIPREFMVYPPAKASTPVEIIYAAAPGQHDSTSETVDDDPIKLRDNYAPMLVDYIGYRAYAKDADNPTNAARSNAFMQTFTTGLGIKKSVDEGA